MKSSTVLVAIAVRCWAHTHAPALALQDVNRSVQHPVLQAQQEVQVAQANICIHKCDLVSQTAV
jgi:hypothetical protein